jgi:hypothetical protein
MNTEFTTSVNALTGNRNKGLFMLSIDMDSLREFCPSGHTYQ